jgi:hypothetical protein
MPPISLYEGPFPLPRMRAARPALQTTLPPDSLCPYGCRRSWALRVVVPPEAAAPWRVVSVSILAMPKVV